MSRDPGLFLLDILESCRKVEALVNGIDFAVFCEDWRTRDAVLHNLEVIGEAVKRLPENLTVLETGVPWRRIAGFRDVVAHAYFSLDDMIIWDVATHHIRPLAAACGRLLRRVDSTR